MECQCRDQCGSCHSVFLLLDDCITILAFLAFYQFGQGHFEAWKNSGTNQMYYIVWLFNLLFFLDFCQILRESFVDVGLPFTKLRERSGNVIFWWQQILWDRNLSIVNPYAYIKLCLHKYCMFFIKMQKRFSKYWNLWAPRWIKIKTYFYKKGPALTLPNG